MSKKIYIKIDKPIEVGDLVRCVRDDCECKSGDIRKVSRLGKNREWFFYTCGSEFPRLNDYWEPVRKENRREEMKQEVAEMIVELLDKEDKENCPQSSVRISNWRDLDNAVTVKDNANKSYEATLHPPDTWDTLTGVYVALSKATGRKLPNWIYGEEKRVKGTQTMDKLKCDDCKTCSMKKYRISVHGCDDCTGIERELTGSEYAFLKEIADEITKTSTYHCMPRMYVDEVETDNE